ncbi:MAG: hypothetical protein LBV67_07120 [Streptococcaceae bacterium]|jgi:hypothetical protein|nr:hypothetical protein [Streptococcaceae bacterium]
MISAKEAGELYNQRGKLVEKMLDYIEKEIRGVAKEQKIVLIPLTEKWYQGQVLSEFSEEDWGIKATGDVESTLGNLGYVLETYWSSTGNEYRNGEGMLKISW